MSAHVGKEGRGTNLQQLATKANWFSIANSRVLVYKRRTTVYLVAWLRSSRSGIELWIDFTRMSQERSTCQDYPLFSQLLLVLWLCRDEHVWYCFRCFRFFQGNPHKAQTNGGRVPRCQLWRGKKNENQPIRWWTLVFLVFRSLQTTIDFIQLCYKTPITQGKRWRLSHWLKLIGSFQVAGRDSLGSIQL